MLSENLLRLHLLLYRKQVPEAQFDEADLAKFLELVSLRETFEDNVSTFRQAIPLIEATEIISKEAAAFRIEELSVQFYVGEGEPFAQVAAMRSGDLVADAVGSHEFPLASALIALAQKFAK